MFLLKLVFRLVLIVADWLFLPSGACGYDQCGINSTITDSNGKEVLVALYNGDVAGLLTDGDTLNDPEPAEVHKCTVGQRTDLQSTRFRQPYLYGNFG